MTAALADSSGTMADADRSALASALDGCEVRRLAVEYPAPVDLSAELARALAEPVAAPPLRELARGCGNVVVITSDVTRAVPAAALLDGVMAELGRGGIGPAAVEVVVGVGAHRPATQGEIERMLGPRWAPSLRVRNHDARAGDLVRAGTTSRSTPLLLDRGVAEAGLVIALGHVEPHEFAGFTGGRKAILPAVAGYETIVRNHSLEMLLHPLARPGILAGNPIHEEMLEAARRLRRCFIVNVVLDEASRPLAVAAGDVGAAHERLVVFLRRCCEVPLPTEAPDLVVARSAPPLDINLYQTVKSLVGIEPLLDAARPGGPWERRPAPVVVLLSRCWDGSGSEEMFEPFETARRQPALAAPGREPSAEALTAAVLARLQQEYTIEQDESYFMARVTPKCRRVIACCPGVPGERLRLVGWEAAADEAAAVGRALELVRGAESERAGDAARRPFALLCDAPQRLLFAHPASAAESAPSDHARPSAP